MYPTTVGGRCVAALAMLMGVLVIAFPVSVFSDLWSHELKQRGVDYEDILDDDNEEIGSSSKPETKNGASLSVRFSDEIRLSEGTGGTSSSIRYRSEAHLSQRTGESLATIESEDEGGVTLNADDVAAITKHLRIMEKSQERIRSILAKYDIDA